MRGDRCVHRGASRSWPRITRISIRNMSRARVRVARATLRASAGPAGSIQGRDPRVQLSNGLRRRSGARRGSESSRTFDSRPCCATHQLLEVGGHSGRVAREFPRRDDPSRTPPTQATTNSPFRPSVFLLNFCSMRATWSRSARSRRSRRRCRRRRRGARRARTWPRWAARGTGSCRPSRSRNR